MKSFVRGIWMLCLFEVALLCTVQGGATFEFENGGPFSAVDAPIFDAQGIALAGTNYLAELYWGTTPGSLAPVVPLPGERFTVTFGTGGYFVARDVEIGPLAGGAYAWLQVRAWDARVGTTYEEAVSRGVGGYGESPLFYAQGGGAGTLPAPPNPLYGLESFRLRPATGVLMSGIHRQGNEMVIQWLPGFKLYQLQQSAGVDQPWQNLGEPTTATSATNTVTNPMGFFRVIAFVE